MVTLSGHRRTSRCCPAPSAAPPAGRPVRSCRRPPVGRGRVSEEAKRAQPVVDGDDDDVAAGRQPARVVDAAAAVDERAAVDPHHHRPLRSSRGGGVHTLSDRQSSAVCLPSSRSVRPACSAGPVAWRRALPATAARVRVAATATARRAVRRREFRRTADGRASRRRGRFPMRSARRPGHSASSERARHRRREHTRPTPAGRRRAGRHAAGRFAWRCGLHRDRAY